MNRTPFQGYDKKEIPAFAGMTERAGMTDKKGMMERAGMTVKKGMTE
ncbi:MAG: hypothetical protein ACR2P4_10290 [Gammaproteobacteria bacterium]